MKDQHLRVYCDLLTEIKFRVDEINNALAGSYPMRVETLEEFCYLQLRMICEIIAIGCLVVHEDISSKRADLFKSYKADWIISQMEKLHPKFFPSPLEREDDLTRGVPEWIAKKNGFLTAENIKNIWQQCGSMLHRGSAKSANKIQRKPDFVKIMKWRDGIIGLMNRHTILSHDENSIVYAIMKNENGGVSVQLFQRLE
jgi:hypothetical protein